MRASRWIPAVALVLTGACSDSSGPAPAITLELETESVALTQGASQVVDVTIVRSNYDKAVALEVQGTLPAGVTAALTQSSLGAGQTTTFLTITASGNATPTAAITLAVVASGEGVTGQTKPLLLSVTLRGSYTLALLESAVTVAQGGGGSATVTLARSGGNQSDVALSLSGAPAGVTAAFAQATSASDAVSLNISATTGVSPGSYSLTITSAAAGHPLDQTATVTINVIAAPSTSSVTIPICVGNAPIWFAYRNEGFPWQRVTPGVSSIVIDATEKVAIAFAFSANNQSELVIYHLTRAELSAFNDRQCPGSRVYTGTVTGLSSAQSALIRAGRASDLVTPTAPSYLLENLPARPLDQVAVRGLVNQTGSAATLTPDKVVIRRGIDSPSATVLPEINFDAAEAITLTSTTLTLNGILAGETVFVSNLLIPVTQTSGLMQVSIASGPAVTLYSVPADRLDANDLQEQNIYAENSTGLIGHTAVAFTRAPADRTITLGALLPTPSVSTAVSSPYARLRATLASQSDYPSLAVFTFLQSTFSGARFIWHYVSAGYLGGTPATWDIILPDLSGVSGFQASWMPATGQNTAFLAEAFSGRSELIFGGVPVEGDVYREAFHQSSVATLRAFRDGTPMQPRRRGSVMPQYFSR